jgi:hypothetical protein
MGRMQAAEAHTTCTTLNRHGISHPLPPIGPWLTCILFLVSLYSHQLLVRLACGSGEQYRSAAEEVTRGGWECSCCSFLALRVPLCRICHPLYTPRPPSCLQTHANLRRFSSGGDEPAEPSCLTYTDQDSCLEHACGWCSSSVLGDLGCVAEGLAKLVPQVRVRGEQQQQADSSTCAVAPPCLRYLPCCVHSLLLQASTPDFLVPAYPHCVPAAACRSTTHKHSPWQSAS